MSENMNPVPMPGTPDIGATTSMPPVPAPSKSRPKWLIPAIAAGCAVVLVAGGFGGWTAWNAHALNVAQSACADASKTARAAAKKYDELAKGDAKTAGTIKIADVKDQKTVTMLASELKATAPADATCPTGDKTGLGAAAGKLTKRADWYRTHTKSLSGAVKAVESSKLDKTVDAANALLKDSDGKVADGKTRDALSKAIKARDAKAIATAMKSVNDSVKAKSDADAKAQADQANAQAQAAQQAAGGAASGQAYTGGGYANTGYTGGEYTGGGYSGGGYTGGGASGGNGGGSPAPAPSGGNNGGSSSGPQWGLGCEVSESNPSCSWETDW